MIMNPCAYCAAPGPHRTLTAKEMMFRRGDSFEYMECFNCGSIQIIEIPEDLGRFYPSNYYAHGGARAQSLRVRMERFRDRFVFNFGPIFGSALGSSFFARVLHPLRREGLNTDQKVLDVGCGTGALLVSLGDVGFRRLLGVDPYSVNTSPHPNVTIQRGTLGDMDDVYDLIIFNHSLEHMTDPVQTLRQASEKLAPHGHIIVRIPVAGCYAWRTQGIDWIQLDAPRHLTLPTPRGFHLGADRAGLRVKQTVFDSYWLQFVGAAIYEGAQGAGLGLALQNSPFSKRQMRAWNRRAKELNAAADGDQAAFVLERSTAAIFPDGQALPPQ